MKKFKLQHVLVILAVAVFLIFLFNRPRSVTTNLTTNQGYEILSTKSGEPMLANGNCNYDSDCVQTGCSAHICANHEIVTTCELIDFPEKETYSCGCINNLCVWYR